MKKTWVAKTKVAPVKFTKWFLFNLVKMVVSALYKELECKVEKLNIE